MCLMVTTGTEIKTANCVFQAVWKEDRGEVPGMKEFEEK